MDSDFETLIDLPLGLDPDEITRSELDPVAAGVIDDKTIDLMSKENRVGIARGAPTALNSSAVPAGRSIVDIPLLFALQAHPDCVYRWARIVVDLSVTEGALIHGMSPDDVQDVPVSRCLRRPREWRKLERGVRCGTETARGRTRCVLDDRPFR